MSDLFNRPLELWRPTAGTEDGMGGVEGAGMGQVGAELLAKVDQPSAKDERRGAALGATLAHSIYFDGDIDVRRGDELRDPAPGVGVFTVVDVVQPSEPVYTKALVERRQVDGDPA